MPPEHQPQRAVQGRRRQVGLVEVVVRTLARQIRRRAGISRPGRDDDRPCATGLAQLPHHVEPGEARRIAETVVRAHDIHGRLEQPRDGCPRVGHAGQLDGPVGNESCVVLQHGEVHVVVIDGQDALVQRRPLRGHELLSGA